MVIKLVSLVPYFQHLSGVKRLLNKRVYRNQTLLFGFLLMSLALPNVIFARLLGTQGTVYEIKEKDALASIEETLHRMSSNGEIARQQEKLKEQALENLEHPRPVKGLKTTQVARTFEKDLTVTLSFDIRDEKGQIIHPKGTKINPLNKTVSNKALLFLDGEDAKQLAWGLERYQQSPHLIKLVLVNGPALALMRTHQIPFYFDQAGRLIEYFTIEQVPAEVSQSKDKLQIREIKL